MNSTTTPQVSIIVKREPKTFANPKPILFVNWNSQYNPIQLRAILISKDELWWDTIDLHPLLPLECKTNLNYLCHKWIAKKTLYHSQERNQRVRFNCISTKGLLHFLDKQIQDCQSIENFDSLRYKGDSVLAIAYAFRNWLETDLHSTVTEAVRSPLCSIQSQQFPTQGPIEPSVSVEPIDSFSPVSKAQRTTVELVGISLELFMMPNGDYFASQTSASATLNKHPESISEFCQSNSVKALLGNGFEFRKIELTVSDSNKPIKAIPLDVLAAYWRHWDRKGNPIATTLVNGLLKRSLTEVADVAFGVKRNKRELDKQLKQELAQASSLPQVENQVTQPFSPEINRAFWNEVSSLQTELEKTRTRAEKLSQQVQLLKQEQEIPAIGILYRQFLEKAYLSYARQCTGNPSLRQSDLVELFTHPHTGDWSAQQLDLQVAKQAQKFPKNVYSFELEILLASLFWRQNQIRNKHKIADSESWHQFRSNYFKQIQKSIK